MTTLKHFSFANDWQLEVQEETGHLFFKVLHGAQTRYAFEAMDAVTAENLCQGQTRYASSVVNAASNMKTYRLIGTRVQREEAEDCLTLHTVPVDDALAPLDRLTAHYRFEKAGENAVRITTWFSCREPLKVKRLNWLSLLFDRSKFENCQGFDPDYTMAVDAMSHGVHFGSVALTDAAGFVALTDCGEANYQPTCGDGTQCAIAARPGQSELVDLSLLDAAHALTAVIVFGDGKPALPSVSAPVLPALPQVKGERHTLTSGRLTTAVYARPYGVSAANLSLDTFAPTDERCAAPVLNLSLREIATGKVSTYTSEYGWDKVTVKGGRRELRIDLEKPQGLPIRVCITARAKENDTIAWSMRVINDSADYSVLSATWPGVGFSGGDPVFFRPSDAGRIEPSPYARQDRFRCLYPAGFDGVCPVLGVYDPNKKTNSGLYVAIHAPQAARIDINAAFFRNQSGFMTFDYPAESMGKPFNSFQPAGELIVRVLDGDWYDMACIYEAYLKEHADWYAPLGREDSPEWMKDVPMYIMDWMPNDNPDADPVPISIRPAVEPPRDNWYRKPIELADKLGLPIGYHLYNWHFNPFNNDFPFYFPVKEGLVEGVDEMNEHGIHVMPYINGRIVDTRARDLSTDRFDKVFGPSATRSVDGELDIETYASHETDGTLCRLAAMCPSTHVWRETLAAIVRRLFREYHMSAVYIDQVAAARINLCCAPNHNHEPGNGSWWVKEYRLLMARLKQECLPECGFTTESNAEPYADQFDGFLTWAWVFPNMVPFFPKLYAGRIALLGRNTNGYKKSDKQYFRFHVSQAVMFGQQIGWINADVADDEEKMTFLYRLCHMRWDYKDFFSQGSMLRPPVSTTPVPTYLSDSSMGYDEMLPAPMVVSSAWEKDGTKNLFFVNTGLEEVTLTFECHMDGLTADKAVKVYGDAQVIALSGSQVTVRLGGASGLVMEG